MALSSFPSIPVSLARVCVRVQTRVTVYACPWVCRSTCGQGALVVGVRVGTRGCSAQVW